MQSFRIKVSDAMRLLKKEVGGSPALGDGDQPTKEPKDDEKVKEVKKVAKEVKEI